MPSVLVSRFRCRLRCFGGAVVEEPKKTRSLMVGCSHGKSVFYKFLVNRNWRRPSGVKREGNRHAVVSEFRPASHLVPQFSYRKLYYRVCLFAPGSAR